MMLWIEKSFEGEQGKLQYDGPVWASAATRIGEGTLDMAKRMASKVARWRGGQSEEQQAGRQGGTAPIEERLDQSIETALERLAEKARARGAVLVDEIQIEIGTISVRPGAIIESMGVEAAIVHTTAIGCAWKQAPQGTEEESPEE